ncbi:MAG: hypothetical protein ACYCT2_09080 [Thermoplasmataceae archaeon]
MTKHTAHDVPANYALDDATNTQALSDALQATPVTLPDDTPNPELSLADNKTTWQEKLKAMQKVAIKAAINPPARDFYGEKLNCTAILFDTEDRDIGDGVKVKKSSYHTLEHGWIDSYTLACHSFAVMVTQSLGTQSFPEPIQIVFTSQITKHHRGRDNKETDRVQLVYTDIS